jgi:hemoglobin
MESLYERIGGEAAIVAAVDLFYEKVMADPRTRPFFSDLDMTTQIQKQRSFLAWALGAPEQYKGRDLRTAHAKLVKERGLGDVHFDAVAEHLRATLVELQVPNNLIDEALSIVAGTRDQVLGR